MPGVGWNRFHPARHLSVMSFQRSFCSLTWKTVSFCLGRQPYHLFGPVFSEPWTRDPLTPHLQLHSIPGGPDVSCSGLGQTVDKPQAVMATRRCSGGSRASLALLARSSWLDLLSQWWRGVLVGSCGMLRAEMPFPFAERMAVTTYEMERDSPRSSDAGTVLGGEMGKQE